MRTPYVRPATLLATLVLAAACTETVVQTETVVVTDTLVVTDTVVPAPARYRLDTLATGLDRPVAVQADAEGLLVALQAGTVVRTDGTVVHDLRTLVPEDLNFVGGIRNFLVHGQRRLVFLTTRTGAVLVADVGGGGVDTLLVSDEFGVQHYGGGMGVHGGRILLAFGDGNTGTGRGPGLPGRLVALDPDTRSRTELARGLRNPWRLAVAGDSVWIADPGDRAWEEVNVFRLGGPPADFGWGVSEGTHCTAGDCTGVTWPVYAYRTGPQCSSVVGGAWYDGRFWFGDWCEGWIRSLGAGPVQHHFDLADPVVGLSQGAPQQPPWVVTGAGAVFRIVREAP